MNKTQVFLILIFLLLANNFGVTAQVSPETLDLVLGTANIRQGMRFNATIDVPVTDLTSFSINPPQWPDSLTLVIGPELSRIPAPRHDLPSPGTRITYFFRADQAGWAIIPEFRVEAGGVLYVIPETIVPLLPPGTATTVPPVLQWKIGAGSLVEGQSTSAFLELSFMEEYLLPESLSVDPLSRGVLEEVTGLGSVVSEKFGGRDFQRYPVASFIITADSVGSLTLPPAQVVISGIRVTSPGITIPVNPLPPSVASTGAVGNFSLTGNPSAQAIRVGELLRFTLRLEGEGNVSFLQVPDPLVTGGRITSQTETFRLTPVFTGWRGFREVVYRIIAEREGALQIVLPQYPMYNIEQGRVIASPSQTFTVQVDPGVVNAMETEGELGLISPIAVLGYNILELYTRPETYLLLVPPGFIGIGILLGNRKRKFTLGRGSSFLLILLVFTLVFGLSFSAIGNHPSLNEQRELLSRAEEHFDKGEFVETLKIYRLVEDQLNFTNPGLLYNQSLTLLADSRPSEAIFYLRQARRILPGDLLFMDSLNLLEESLGLTRQLVIPSLPRGDFFFFLFFGSVFIFLLFLPYWIRELSSGKIIILTFMTLLFVIGVVGLGWYINNRYESEGIVRAGDEYGGVTKIPEERASIWLKLPAGTSVYIDDISGDYSLIKTSYGIEGWMLSSDLWVRGEQYE